MTYNTGVLNPHQLVQLLDVLSDDNIDNTSLANLQNKLQNSFIPKDSLKVKLVIFDLTVSRNIDISGCFSISSIFGRWRSTFQSKPKNCSLVITFRTMWWTETLLHLRYLVIPTSNQGQWQGIAFVMPIFEWKRKGILLVFRYTNCQKWSEIVGLSQ